MTFSTGKLKKKLLKLRKIRAQNLGNKLVKTSDEFVITFFFLDDLFLYLAIDTVFHPS